MVSHALRISSSLTHRWFQVSFGFLDRILEMMSIQIIFTVALTFCAPTVLSSNIFWTHLTVYRRLFGRFQPAGLFDGGRHLYLCQTYIEQYKMRRSGWFELLNEGKVSHCGVGINGKEYKGEIFQVLHFPPGSTSWVPFSSKLSANPITEGGYYRNVQQGEVCRAYHNNSLLPGFFYSSKGACLIALDGTEVSVKDTDRIEILIQNIYGEVYGEKFPGIGNNEQDNTFPEFATDLQKHSVLKYVVG